MICFEMPWVIGYSRVPEPPARMIPFTISLPAGGSPGGGCQKPLRRGEDVLAHVRGLQDGGVARLLEDLLDEVALALERPLDDDRAVGELGEHRALLGDPAGVLGRDPDVRDTRALDLTRARPTLDVADRVEI